MSGCVKEGASFASGFVAAVISSWTDVLSVFVRRSDKVVPEVAVAFERHKGRAAEDLT